MGASANGEILRQLNTRRENLMRRTFRFQGENTGNMIIAQIATIIGEPEAQNSGYPHLLNKTYTPREYKLLNRLYKQIKRLSKNTATHSDVLKAKLERAEEFLATCGTV